jgi:signal transduction histidine kinase
LQFAAGSLRCAVVDDGDGIDAEVTSLAVSRGHHGLALAHKRLELAGGALAVTKTANGGTSFAFDLPVRQRTRHLEAIA